MSFLDQQMMAEIGSQVHGSSHFDKMFQDRKSVSSERISLRHKMICAFYFDKENNFSGIKTYDINS